ncbi:MAG: amidohydrolase family protein [Thermodesulfobacteriota bacterium]
MFKSLTKIPIIDSHVHVFPQKLSDAVRCWFESHAWRFMYQGTAEDLIRILFDNGVSGVVLLTYAHRTGISYHLNEFTANLVKHFPNTVGLATLHPQDENPREIIRLGLMDLGLRGIKLHCHVQKTAPDDPLLFPIYEAVLEFDGVLNIHAGREPAIDAYGLDVRTITGAERVEKVLQSYPELKMIVPHLGFDEADRFYSLLDHYHNLYLDTTMMMGHFFHVSVDRNRLIQYADRILYGSDYPHIPYGMETEVRAILDLHLGEEATRKILFENATKLFQTTLGS